MEQLKEFKRDRPVSMVNRSLKKGAVGALALVFLFMAACSGKNAKTLDKALEFGTDVLMAAAQNFAPQYATLMQVMFNTLKPLTESDDSEEGGDQESDEHAWQEGQGGDQEGHYQDGEDSYGSQEHYPEGDQGGYAQNQQGGYDQQIPQGGYPQNNQPYYPPPNPSGNYGQPAPSQAPPPNYMPQNQQIPQYPPPASGGNFGQPAPAPGYNAPVSLQVALLAQHYEGPGRVSLRPVPDGAVLRDGRSNPAAGDKIKIFFSANCDCYVYVIGIDATGYVAQIFPGNDGRMANPVNRGRKYLIPEGTTWWGLDNYRGVEQIYFVVSKRRRTDIESIITQMAGQPRKVPNNYRPVRKPAIIPVTRGLVQVQSAAPTVIPGEYGNSQEVTPQQFSSTVRGADLVITRWFYHE